MESVKAYADKVVDEKVSMLAETQHARSELHQIRANMTWVVRYLDERRIKHFANIEVFKVRMEKIIQVQEEKLRGLSIEYDEELYPHLMSTIAEHMYVIISSCHVALLYMLVYFI